MHAENEARSRNTVLTTNQEMRIIDDLKLNNDEKFRDIFQKGEYLVRLAEAGSLRKLQSIIECLEDDEFVPMFFLSEMMKKALIGGYLIVVGYIIDKGYPLNNPKIPCVLHECLSVVPDHLAEEIIKFLYAKGFDINLQVYPNMLTTLHIAVKQKLVNTVKCLLGLGADPNAVAKEDIMPLNIAQKSEQDMENEAITEILIQKGAKPTWRKSSVLSATPQTTPLPAPQFRSFSSLSNSIIDISSSLPSQEVSTLSTVSFSPTLPQSQIQTSTMVSCKPDIINKNGNRVICSHVIVQHEKLPFQNNNLNVNNFKDRCCENTEDTGNSIVRNNEDNSETNFQISPPIPPRHWSTSDDGGYMFST